MSEPSSTHPAEHPDVVAMRESEPVIRNIDWDADRTYKVWFDRRATETDIEYFLDTVDTEYPFTPTDEQNRGQNVLLKREAPPIESTESGEGSDDE